MGEGTEAWLALAGGERINGVLEDHRTANADVAVKRQFSSASAAPAAADWRRIPSGAGFPG